ncbi:MAG: formylglycine-generating enzyme family protein, partial [Myxococcota bacterium]
WYEAEAFCRWMTQKWSLKEGRRVVRLPSEAEWEYAARGKEGRRYPWGNDELTTERANFHETGLGQTSPVGALPLMATPEGVHDMAGNVWEWCEDWYGKYPNSVKINPSGSLTGSIRVLRGGSWSIDASDLRGADRHGDGPSNRYINVGFRVVWSASRGAAL